MIAISVGLDGVMITRMITRIITRTGIINVGLDGVTQVRLQMTLPKKALALGVVVPIVKASLLAKILQRGVPVAKAAITVRPPVTQTLAIRLPGSHPPDALVRQVLNQLQQHPDAHAQLLLLE